MIRIGIERDSDRPDRREPTPHELRAFLALWEERHFGRAAARMGIAQSSFSETLRRLETKLGTVLFHRTSRQVTPTEFGGDLRHHARRVLDELARASGGSSASSVDDNAIRIGLEGQGFAELNGPIVAAINQLFPQAPIIVREVTGDPQSFFDERVDVALMRTPIDDERFSRTCVAHEERGVLGPVWHDAIGAPGLSAAGLLDEPFVELVPLVGTTRDYWLGGEPRGGEKANIGGWASTAHDAVFAVAFNGLLSTGSPSAVRAFPNAPMGFIPTRDLEPARWEVVTLAADQRPRTQMLLDVIREVVETRHTQVPGVWLPGAFGDKRTREPAVN